MNDSVLVVGEEGDWLRVLPVPPNIPVDAARGIVQRCASRALEHVDVALGDRATDVAPGLAHVVTSEAVDEETLDGVLREAQEALDAKSTSVRAVEGGAENDTSENRLYGRGSRVRTGRFELLRSGSYNEGDEDKEGTGRGHVMWALRRQGDMLYLASVLTCVCVCVCMMFCAVVHPPLLFGTWYISIYKKCRAIAALFTLFNRYSINSLMRGHY